METNAAVSSSNIVRLNSTGVRVVCLSYLDLGSSSAHLRHSITRIRRQIADATVVVGLWGHADDENRKQLQTTTAADYYVSSLREALSLCIDAASGGLAKVPAMRDTKAASAAPFDLRGGAVPPKDKALIRLAKPRGEADPCPRRGAADRGEHRQAAGAADADGQV